MSTLAQQPLLYSPYLQELVAIPVPKSDQATFDDLHTSLNHFSKIFELLFRNTLATCDTQSQIENLIDTNQCFESAIVNLAELPVLGQKKRTVLEIIQVIKKVGVLKD